MDELWGSGKTKNGQDDGLQLSLLNQIRKKLFVHKTSLCKHDANCGVNALKGFLKNCLCGYGIKIGFQVLFMLIMRKVKLKSIWRNLISADTMQFSLFLSMVWFLYKSSLCILRRLNLNDDKLNSLIAGILCSTAAFADKNSSRRQMIILYIFARTLESLIKVLDQRDIVKEKKDWGLYVMFLGGTFISYTLFWEYDVAIPSIKKTMDKFACLKVNELILRQQVYCKVPL